MASRPNIFERAYEMAGMGAQTDVIIKTLNTEGYEGVDLHFAGSGMRRKLIDIRKRARNRV